jgi:sec-independent protein translocase protein TatC
MPVAEENEPGWVSHLEELRRRVIFCIAFFLLAFIGVFIFVEPVVRFLLRPLSGIPAQLSYFQPWEKFMACVRVSFTASFVLTLPAMAVQGALFLAPGLYPHEKRWLCGGVVAVPVSFVLGAVFAYILIVPAAFRFLLGFAPGTPVNAVLGIGCTLDFVTGMIAVTGIVFELPVALFALMAAKVVSAKTLGKYRRHTIVVILIVAGVATPSPDPVTQVLVALPLYLLFELTLLLGRFVK